MRRRLVLEGLGAAALVLVMPPAFAQAPGASAVREVHGADGVYADDEVAIVWAVLKDATGDRAAVWLRIVDRRNGFSHVRVDGVDPFTKTREAVVPGVPLGAEVKLSADRDGFSALPSRELHFYRTEADFRAGRAALNVYYLGVPDQTPEFTAKAAMDRYLDTAKLVSHPVGVKKP